MPGTERGVALLWTLVAVVMVAGSSMALVRVAVHDRVRRDINQDSLLARDLLRESERPIVEWLSTRARSLVLSAATKSATFPVLHHRWSIDQRVFELRIHAFDQDGMISARDASSGSPLRMLLPVDLRDLVDDADLSTLPDSAPIGLDQFQDHGGDPASESARSIFPLQWNAETNPPFLWDGDIEVYISGGKAFIESEPIAAGQIIATHGQNRLNVNTAPIELVETVFRLTGRGGVEQVIASRNGGSPVGNVPPAAVRNDSAAMLPQLVTSSDCFAFRVDLRVNRVRPSWWMIYQRGGENGWTCIQRIPVP